MVLPFWYRFTWVVPEKRVIKRVCVLLLSLWHGVTQPTVSKHWKNTKHWSQPVAWPHCFAIHHKTLFNVRSTSYPTSIPEIKYYYYFTSAAAAVDSTHMTASSSTSYSRFSPPSNFVNGHVSTMWFHGLSLEGDWARPHLCKLAPHGTREKGISILVASLLIWSITQSSNPNRKTNDATCWPNPWA